VSRKKQGLLLKIKEVLADGYKYGVAFEIANYHHFSDDIKDAKKWYKISLDENWKPSRLSEQVDYARNYQKMTL
jgi:hypothetical protein